MNKHTIGDLYQMQSLPLSAKVRMAQYRIREWVIGKEVAGSGLRTG